MGMGNKFPSLWLVSALRRVLVLVAVAQTPPRARKGESPNAQPIPQAIEKAAGPVCKASEGRKQRRKEFR